MQSLMNAIEMTGMVDEKSQLKLDGLMPFSGPKRVRIIVLSSRDDESEDISEEEWLRAAARNPVFSFLDHPDEDIYSLTDGQPFHDEI